MNHPLIMKAELLQMIKKFDKLNQIDWLIKAVFLIVVVCFYFEDFKK